MLSTFAPITSPREAGKLISPAATNPTVATVTAVDDCSSAVAQAPVRAPERGERVKLSSSRRSCWPARLRRPSLSRALPWSSGLTHPCTLSRQTDADETGLWTNDKQQVKFFTHDNRQIRSVIW